MLSTAKSIAPTKQSARARIVAFAILMPAAVAATDQLLFEQLRTHPRLSPWLYPWMVFTTAVLSWSIGRYLSPARLCWLVFGWSLMLLDLMTFAACLSQTIRPYFGYVLVSAQITLLTLWAILAPVTWQWRLPAALVAAAAVIVFSGSFMTWWGVESWNVLMALAAAFVAMACAGLRFRGVRLHPPTSQDDHVAAAASDLRQFGTRHLLIWATAIVPLLLIMRRIDLSWLHLLATGGAFSAGLLAACLAIVHLIAIAAVLARGHRGLRLAALFGAPPVIALVFRAYPAYSQSTFLSFRPTFISFLVDMRDDWMMWFVLNTAMLAALLLFLRARGYRLERSPNSH